ncbi:hypothetical protein C5C07_17555 [Haloferax sp. Atlit-4N]|uniref:DUF624 domain-containing protein n=1 Tax=Haloferax sp. Atlit-4N TaxID=2077206 RepID=UPI000E27C700|nr:DUF624 domain-containing protein [Haloferax sp. Atlit-4N]RDZ51372.1 hypothetical protein C5C07_17555 [Haloferax sp. Atlit-4N]
MSTDQTARQDFRGSLTTFARVLYSDLVTIILQNVLFVLGSVPIITVGASLLALSTVLTAVVRGENRGGPTTERERVRLFTTAYRENLTRGLPYSLALASVVLVTTIYVTAYTLDGSLFLFLTTMVGLYLLVIFPLWLLRAASVTVRAPSNPGFRKAMQDGADIALNHPYFSVLQIAIAGVLALLMVFFPGLTVIFVPGAIALLEVIMYEELVGRGASDVANAYRGRASW